MKRIKSIIMLILMGGILLMSGCEANSCKDLRAESKELLLQKYNEEFNVLSFQDRGDIWIAECSPIENEQVIFKARFDKEPEMLVLDDYEEKYLADLLNEELKKDIEVFFRVHTYT